MKKIFILLFALMTFMANAQSTDSPKTAILMVHFGTTHDDTREVTIDAINQKVRTTFPEATVVEAYTSRIIINRLDKRGIHKDTPREALLKLAAEGYSNVIIQSTNVIDGIEAESLRDEVEYMTPFFAGLRIGRPLLYSVEDCEKVVDILAQRYADCVKAKNSSVVFIGHGTETPATAIYSQMDYMFSAKGHPRFHVSTIEGYPTFDNVVEVLNAEKAKELTLIPLMFVAGDHARNDIDTDWRQDLEGKGFKVTTVIEGLGQVPSIQDLYIDHIRQAMKEKPLSPSQMKKAFIKENL